MNKETIEYIVNFLNRVDLKGSEVPAFNKIQEELIEEYNKNIPNQPKLKEQLQDEYFPENEEEDEQVDSDESLDDREPMQVVDEKTARYAPTINEMERQKEIKKIDDHPIEITKEETSVSRSNSYSPSSEFDADPFEKTKEMLNRRKK